jgi:2,3,4,5-tetrahydropyridine-2-carboxylate N-succinyltransferase
MQNAKEIIQNAWQNRELLKEKETLACVEYVIEELDKGRLRVAEPNKNENGDVESWQVNDWVKQAVIMYFPTRQMETMHAGPMEFHDKMRLKSDYAKLGIRVVPHAVARYGAFISPGVILMPSYVNIGAYVDSGTMVDTWATVGSCAQIGKNVHLSGGVGIGGVLEPVQAAPVIVEDDCFVGSRCIVVEGVRVGREAVLGAGLTLTMSTKIMDAQTGEELPRGYIPPRSVVIPGNMKKTFAGGDFYVPCALIIGQRKASTDTKTTLNDALREFNVAV